jgi:hypothetical protein
VRVGKETIQRIDNDPVEIAGRVIPDPTHLISRRDALDAAKLSLAGYVYERIVNPHGNGLLALLGGAAADWSQACDWVRFSGWTSGEEMDIERFINSHLCLKVREFLILNWSAVMQVGGTLRTKGELALTEVQEIYERELAEMKSIAAKAGAQ